MVRDDTRTLEQRALAALTLGGGSTLTAMNDAERVFQVMAQLETPSSLLTACRAAWVVTRSPMAYFLPLISLEWKKCGTGEVAHDDLPPVSKVQGIPTYGLDQFTRLGLSALRNFARKDDEVRLMLERSQVPAPQRHRWHGDILFLHEGGLVRSRVRWSVGAGLASPYRQLGNLADSPDHVCELRQLLDDRWDAFEKYRTHQLSYALAYMR